MVSSKAMLKMAATPAARPAADGTAPSAPDIDRRITQTGKDLLQSSLEVQSVVREAAQAILEKVAAGEKVTGDLSVQIGRSLQEFMLALTSRLDEQGGGFSGSSAVVAQMIAQMNSLVGTQQKAGGRLQEEMTQAQ